MVSSSLNLAPLSIIILAAGKGSRMKSNVPKVMHSLAGRPMIGWLLEAVSDLNPDEVIVVVGSNMEALEEYVKPHKTVIQKVQKGTGDAVKTALPHISKKSGRVLILLGDEPFVPVEALSKMIESDDPVVMAFEAEDPYGFGRMMLRTDGTLKSIVEERDASADEKKLTLCNAGNFCVSYDELARWLPQITRQNAQEEYYLTDLPLIAAKENVFFQVVTADAPQGWGINDRIQLAAHEAYIQDILRVEAMKEGVTMMDPLTTYLSFDTVFGNDVTIEPNVVFGAGVQVGDHVEIKAFSHIEQAKIGNDCVIGPFARLRPGAILHEKVKIGNFVEVKNSMLHAGVKANHLAYIGDAEIGAGTNFSCGAITVNYDGYQKHKTIIGKNVMIGSNVSLIAPIKIGDDAFVAAGSTISVDVPEKALAIERQKADITEGWIQEYRKRKKK